MIPAGERPAEPAAAEVKRPRRHLTGTRALITLVACCGLILWAGRVVWESRDPILSEDKADQARALRALGSRTATERVEAIRALALPRLVDNAIVIRPLLPMLRDDDAAVRAAAVSALGPIGSRAIQAGSDDDAVRDAVSALIRVLKEPDPGLRRAAVSSLGTMSSTIPGIGADPQEAPPPTVPGSKTKKPAPQPASVRPSPVDRAAAIAALTEALDDRDAGVRYAAIIALATLFSTGDPPELLAAGLSDESAENRKAAVRALVRYQSGLDPWIPRLLRIAEYDADSSARKATVDALRMLAEPPKTTVAVIPALTEALGSRDPWVRRLAAQSLFSFGSKATPAIPALLRVIADPIDREEGKPGTGLGYEGFTTSGAAASALGKIAPGSTSAPEVITALTELVRSSQGFLQIQAVGALGRFGPAAAPAIPAIIGMMREGGLNQDPHRENEQAAAKVLGQIAPGTPAAADAVAALEEVLRSRRAWARVAAVESLGRLGPAAAASLPKIRALRADPDVEVKMAVQRALAALGDEELP